MPRRLQPEIACYGCGVIFRPKCAPGSGRDPRKRFHSRRCAALTGLRETEPGELERRRIKGRETQRVTLARATEARWSREARRLVRMALIDVRADLTMDDCEPLVRALVMELRRNYLLGYRVAHRKQRRDAAREAA